MGGGATGLGIIPKKQFFTAFLKYDYQKHNTHCFILNVWKQTIFSLSCPNFPASAKCHLWAKADCLTGSAAPRCQDASLSIKIKLQKIKIKSRSVLKPRFLSTVSGQ